MKSITRIFVFLMLLVGFSASLSGCAYGFQDCDKYAGMDEYNECLASQGNQDIQYELGLAAYNEGEMDTAIKWLKLAAKPRDNRTPIFIPTGNGEVRIQLEETGLSTRGHYGAQQLLAKIYGEEN